MQSAYVLGKEITTMRIEGKVPYEEARLEILLLCSGDIITTSSGPMAGGTDTDNDRNWDGDGWTT